MKSADDLDVLEDAWNEGVWNILDAVEPAELAAIARLEQSEPYRELLSRIPADSLKAACLHVIRALAGRYWESPAARALRGSIASRALGLAELLPDLRALPATLGAGSVASGKTFHPHKALGFVNGPDDVEALRVFLTNLAAGLKAMDKLREPAGGLPDYAQNRFITVMGILARHFAGDPLIPVMVRLYKELFGKPIDPETYRRREQRLQAAVKPPA
jgi:hypothetical protein